MSSITGPPVAFAEAFRFWVKLGFISFGGPAGQIAIMHRELVARRKWLSEAQFLHALNYCMLLPGPEAQQLAIYAGWLLHGTRGGLVAGLFFILPSIFILLALSYIYAAYGELAAIAGLLAGFKPVVVAIVVDAVFRIGRRAIRSRAHLLIAALAFLAIYFLRVPFPLIVLLAALAGLAGAKLWPRSFVFAEDSPRNEADDAIKIPKPSLRSRRVYVARSLVVGILLWALPFVALVLWRGWSSLHAQAYRFFTQAALVTFGGAYSVHAYVTQAAVGSYGWLTEAQAVDGLALAETTPGPLIMVLQFVGFMAGWNQPMEMNRTLSAMLAAFVATYATFLPCFIFIFVGAPYIENLRGNRRLNAALSAITASVVGVILNLALVFGATVLFTRGAGGTDLFAVALTVSAFVALFRFKLEVLWVVLAGGLVGLARGSLIN